MSTLLLNENDSIFAARSTQHGWECSISLCVQILPLTFAGYNRGEPTLDPDDLIPGEGAQAKKLEKKRLKHLHRQFSEELQNLEAGILQASLNKLRREASERSRDASEISDGYLSPNEESESVSSDVFGAPDESRHRKRSFLTRLDENSEMQPNSASLGRSGTKARPVTRRSISRELFDVDRGNNGGPQVGGNPVLSGRGTGITKARPVTRRSVSRELFDVNFEPRSSTQTAPMSSSFRHAPPPDMPDFDSLRQQMRARERSMSRDFEQFCSDNAFPNSGNHSFGPSASLFPDRSHRAGSLSRQSSNSEPHHSGYMSPPSRPSFSSRMQPGHDLGGGSHMLAGQRSRIHGGGGGGFNRRGTPLGGGFDDDEDDGSLFMSRFGPQSGGFGAGSGNNGGFMSSLEDRGRGDWRRISVPERGKDFKSLPRKYNR